MKEGFIMIYILPTLWIIISIIIGIVTKSLIYFSYSILYGCFIAIIFYSIKWIKNATTYSLYKFCTINGVVTGEGMTKVTAYNRRVSWFMKGTVLKAFFVEYKYLVVKDHDGLLMKVLISEINPHIDNDGVINYELNKEISLHIAKYNSEYFIEKEFWRGLNF